MIVILKNWPFVLTWSLSMFMWSFSMFVQEICEILQTLIISWLVESLKKMDKKFPRETEFQKLSTP